jgi:transcriptional regulator with GAF, ATPase, and Fis domain
VAFVGEAQRRRRAGAASNTPAVPESANLRLHDILVSTANELVTSLDSDACAISRVIGDVLIFVAEAVPSGQSLQLGQGFLVSDFPETQKVLASGRPRRLTLDDEDVDASEARLLQEFGFAALLMLRLDLHGAMWGLVEVYRVEPRPFSDEDVRAATKLLEL